MFKVTRAVFVVFSLSPKRNRLDVLNASTGMIFLGLPHLGFSLITFARISVAVSHANGTTDKRSKLPKALVHNEPIFFPVALRNSRDILFNPYFFPSLIISPDSLSVIDPFSESWRFWEKYQFHLLLFPRNFIDSMKGVAWKIVFFFFLGTAQYDWLYNENLLIRRRKMYERLMDTIL